LFKNKELDLVVVDEIYTFIQAKSKKFYIFTASAYPNQNNMKKKYSFFYLSKHKNEADLLHFAQQQLPQAKVYHSDGALIYPMIFGQKSIAQKSKTTNLIESLNFQLRHYTSALKRKSVNFAKQFDEFNKLLSFIFITKIIQ